MAKEKQAEFENKGVDFDELGISGIQEDDRLPLDTRGKMQIVRIRFDYKTKYWNEITKSGTPIVKFDGFDVTTGERIKYFTLSNVIYKTFVELLAKVGSSVQRDENKIEWHVLKSPVNVLGFEKVSTGVIGQNDYIKIKSK